jgi:acetoin utilization protein AcuB
MRTAAAMTREVIVVPPELPLASANRLMERRRIRHLPVVQGGALLGILSDRDVLRHADAIDRMTCAEAMTPAPITCAPATSVSRVAETMIEHKIDALPVVSEVGRLVGLVTSTDLLALLVDQPEVNRLPFDFQLREAEPHELAATA